MTYQPRENCVHALEEADKPIAYSSHISNSSKQSAGNKKEIPFISTYQYEYVRLILSTKKQQRSSL